MKYVVMKYQRAQPSMRTGNNISATLSMTENPTRTMERMTECVKLSGAKVLQFEILDDYTRAEALYEAINQF